MDLTILKNTVEEITDFATQYGKECTAAAIYHGAWNYFLPSSEISILTFIHPSDEVRKHTPQWIIDMYCRLV